METREIKGKQIALTRQIKRLEDGFAVQSQNSKKFYFVDWQGNCNCPDCENNGGKRCKHSYAVEYFLTIKKTDKQGIVTEQKVRLTYPQAWHAYTEAQKSEGLKFGELLKDLLESVEEPEYSFGRPKLSLKESIFCAVSKVHSQVSSRRAYSLFKNAESKEQIKKTPNYNAINKLLNKAEITPILEKLILLSALPLKSVETSFAVDSTGFRTTQFTQYCQEKHGESKTHCWLKLHACIGTKTNVITACTVTTGNEHDTSYLKELVQETSDNFNAVEYSADKGYSSRANMQFINDLGATPYILFKTGTRPKAFGHSAWKNMWHYFQLHQEEFMQHYHKRSNVETTFHMIKSKLGDCLKSKNFTAQKNELLCKVLAHNILVLIIETQELGINCHFSGNN